MSLGVAVKRRYFQQAVRTQTIQRMFGEMRNDAIGKIERQKVEEEVWRLVEGMPQTLIELNQIVSVGEQRDNLVINVLREDVQKWTKGLKGLNLQQWNAGMQILIKILNYCQNYSSKSRVIGASEQLMVGMGLAKISQNKILKFQILNIIKNYYTSAIKEPSFILNSNNYLKDLIEQLSNMNWKKKQREYIKYITFVNMLIDRMTDVDNLGLVFKLFIEDSQVLIKFMAIVEEIFYHKIENLYEELLCAILKVFVNLTYDFRQEKLNRIFMVSSFKDLMVERINSGCKIGKEFFLQLVLNIMPDEPKLIDFIRNNVSIQILKSGNNFYDIFLDDLKMICWPEYNE